MSYMLRMMLARRGLLMDKASDGTEGGAGGATDDGGSGNGDGGDADGDASTEGDGGSTDDKKSKITDAEAKLLKEVMEKKGALKKANDELTAAKNRLAEFDGIDPAEIKALLKQKKDAETAQLEAKGEWDRLKAQMAEEHGKEKTTLQSLLEAKDGELQSLRSQIAELTVGSAFAQSNFIQQEMSEAYSPSKVRALFGSHFETQDGVVVGYDKPAGAANRTMLVDASGDPLGFEAALQKIVEGDTDRDRLLRSKMKQGAGSKTAPKTSTAKLPTESLHGQAKIASALAAGLLGKK